MAKIKVVTVEIDGEEFDIGDEIIMDAYGESEDRPLVKGIKGKILRADDDSIVLFIHSVSGHKVDESAVWMSDEVVSVKTVDNE